MPKIFQSSETSFRKLLLGGLGLLMIAAPLMAARAQNPRKTTSETEVAQSPLPPPAKMHTAASIMTYGAQDVGLSAGTAAPSLGVLVDVTKMHSIQWMAGIVSTGPFRFGTGFIYRARLHGDRESTWAHLGLGFNMGTKIDPNGTTPNATTYFLNIFPVAGLGLTLGGDLSNISFTFDAGPVFVITPNFRFVLEPLSSLVGFGMHYYFN